MIRQMAVAGTFYPADHGGLKRELDRSFAIAQPQSITEAPIALICPHAGYLYSGPAAASAYSAIPDNHQVDIVVIIGPNHTGFGHAIAFSNADSWETVGGSLPVEISLARQLAQANPAYSLDNMAHVQEHSLETQIPFLCRKLVGKFALLPISLGIGCDECGLVSALELGKELANALRDRRSLIIASTDMSHYISAEAARRQDSYALAAIEHLDPEELVSAIAQHNITMCGVMPTAVVIAAARILGAKTAKLADYRTSGDVTGDMRRVVSYASFVIY